MTAATKRAAKVHHVRKEPGQFLIAPIELLTDPELTDADRRMLLALMLYAGSRSDVWPSRETLASLTGIHVSNVSKRTRRLQQLGWVHIKRRGYRSNRYFLHIPPRLLQSADERSEDEAQASTVALVDPELSEVSQVDATRIAPGFAHRELGDDDDDGWTVDYDDLEPM